MTDAGAAPAARTSSRVGVQVLSALTLVVAAASLAFTWRRLFVGMNPGDESYFVLVPWRWALGARPFVDEQNLLQVPAFLTYPFVKLFAAVTDHDVAGLVLYTRHLSLLLTIGVAIVVFLLLRHLIRWQLALLVASVSVTYIHGATPHLNHDTMALAFLTLSLALGSWPVLGIGGHRFAVASGLAVGLAVIAYPTLLFVAPFMAVLLAFAHGRRFAAMVAQGAFMHPPDPPGSPTGPAAWRTLWRWVCGGLVVLLPFGVLLLSFGPDDLWASWQETMEGARQLHQLGGASKAVAVAQGLWSLVTWRPYLLVAVLAVYVVYRRWPSVGRVMLCALPIALWPAAQHPLLWGSGFVIIYAFLSPYLYLFVPDDRRPAGARLLTWVWVPSLIAGAMTGYTSASAHVSSAVGLAPSLITSGLFLAWSLEAVGAGWGRRDAASRGAPTRARESDQRLTSDPAGSPSVGTWLAFAALTAVVALTVVFQFQQRDVPYWGLTSSSEDGLAAQVPPEETLPIISPGNSMYLCWKEAIGSNTIRLRPGPGGMLPPVTIDQLHRLRRVPTLVVREGPLHTHDAAALRAAAGALVCPPPLSRSTSTLFRTPPAKTTNDVLSRLSASKRTL